MPENTASAQFTVEDNAVRYVTADGMALAEVTFPAVADSVVDIDHTFVDESLRGQGIAGALLERAAEVLAATNRRARTSCSYAAAWFARHPERSDLLA